MAITLSKFEQIRTEEEGQKITTKFVDICHWKYMLSVKLINFTYPVLIFASAKK